MRVIDTARARRKKRITKKKSGQLSWHKKTNSSRLMCKRIVGETELVIDLLEDDSINCIYFYICKEFLNTSE